MIYWSLLWDFNITTISLVNMSDSFLQEASFISDMISDLTLKTGLKPLHIYPASNHIVNAEYTGSQQEPHVPSHVRKEAVKVVDVVLLFLDEGLVVDLQGYQCPTEWCPIYSLQGG